MKRFLLSGLLAAVLSAGLPVGTPSASAEDLGKDIEGLWTGTIRIDGRITSVLMNVSDATIASKEDNWIKFTGGWDCRNPLEYSGAFENSHAFITRYERPGDQCRNDHQLEVERTDDGYLLTWFGEKSNTQFPLRRVEQ